MHLDVRGHPLHTRALSVVISQRADGCLDAHAALLDLRKRGFVPIAGDLQGSGVVHDMRLAAVIDPRTATLRTVEAAQPQVAFEPSVATGGESCRDPIGRLAAIAGARLDAGFARRLSAEIGGPRGCSHILTLGHLLGATAAWVLERDPALNGPAVRRRPGERVLRRDLVVDGHLPAPGRLQLAAQLTEVSFAPAPELAAPMDRFAGEVEVRALAELELPGLAVSRLEAAERMRTSADLAEASWRPRTDATGWLVGAALGAGITARLLERLGDEPADRPLLDVLLMLAPTFVQCAAALSEDWPLTARADRSRAGIGGLPDSCYMWRRDGALDRMREVEGQPPVARASRSGSN